LKDLCCSQKLLKRNGLGPQSKELYQTTRGQWSDTSLDRAHTFGFLHLAIQSSDNKILSNLLIVTPFGCTQVNLLPISGISDNSNLPKKCQIQSFL
jgi:hypothetical protein